MASESDSNVDMSWVELASSGPTAPKRAVSPSTELFESEAKRMRTDDVVLQPEMSIEELVISDATVSAVAPLTHESGAPLRECDGVLNVMTTSLDVPQPEAEPDGMEAQQIEEDDSSDTKGEGVESASKCCDEDCESQEEHTAKLMNRGRVSCLTWPDGELRMMEEDGRLYAEPPQFDYERFNKEFVPSDKMIIEMWPNDPVKRTAYRDAQTELELLNMAFEHHDCEDLSDCEFHDQLVYELKFDRKSVLKEFTLITESLSELQNWQSKHLDMDGELESAKAAINDGQDIFNEPGGTQARQKYLHQLLEDPSRTPEHNLETWEWFQLDEDGKGTSNIKKKLRQRKELFEKQYFGGHEARAKWGYLLWEEFRLQAKVKERPYRGEDISYEGYGCPDWAINSTHVHYAYLIDKLPWPPKHDLETWEWFHLDEDGKGTTKIKMELVAGRSLFEKCYFGGVEARSKWGYLQWEQQNLDADGGTTKIEKRLHDGEDIFWTNAFDKVWAADSARIHCAYLLDTLPRQPNHDLETWEWFHLDQDGKGTTKIKEKLRAGDALFEECYFGGVKARTKWGYLEWEHRNLDADGGTKIEKRLHDGEDIFWGDFYTWAADSARINCAHLLDTLPRQPKHDLETWEWFHLDGDGKGTTKIKKELAAGRKLFQNPYFGGVKARTKWGYLEWEHRNLDADGGTKIEKRLHDGEDIFWDHFYTWKADSAHINCAYLLDTLPRQPKHDLETWEWFHLDEDGKGTSKIKKELAARNYLFERCYFGGVEARSKWGYLEWEQANLDADGGTTKIEKRLHDGQDIFLNWSGASARSRYTHLQGKLARPPKHDLETWEWFHCPGGDLSAIRAKLNNRKSLFWKGYFGGVHARAKYGYLCPIRIKPHRYSGWSDDDMAIYDAIHKAFDSIILKAGLNPIHDETNAVKAIREREEDRVHELGVEAYLKSVADSQSTSQSNNSRPNP